MALTSLSGVQDAAAGMWAQLQQQQAQRAADQAQAKARSLQAQAGAAEATASRAQENARSLNVRSSQAESEARNALLGLAQSSSMGQVQGGLNELHQQLTSLLQDSASTTPVSTSTAAAQPVLNAEGQTTGAVISVVA
ncbi:MAG: hypothetical protein WAV95_08015 [Azonexus sp.]